MSSSPVNLPNISPQVSDVPPSSPQIVGGTHPDICNYTPDKYDEVLNSICVAGITLEDRKEIENLINEYFTSLETKDYKVAYEIGEGPASEKSFADFADFWATRNESIKLISISGYATIIDNEGATDYVFDLPDNIPTTCFDVTYAQVLTPEYSNAFNQLSNPDYRDFLDKYLVQMGSFCCGEKDEKGEWKIGMFGTAP